MNKILSFKNHMESKSHPLKTDNGGYVENVLTPVKLSGQLLPWSILQNGNKESEYKLVCSSGLEYYIVADSKWNEVLEKLCLQEVRVVGLLNARNMTLIPQKIFPKGPSGDIENVIDLTTWKTKKFFEKLVENINSNVVIPVAFLTWMTNKTI